MGSETIHCACLHGGTHPHCEAPRNSICSHTTCRSLLLRCEEKGAFAQCTCRFNGQLSRCAWPTNVFPSKGNDECENDSECQETFLVDYFCYKGRCIMQGCRTSKHCPIGKCSFNGLCDPCLRNPTCEREGKTCLVKNDNFECQSRCKTNCPENQVCEKVNGNYQCVCKNKFKPPKCKNECEKCDGSPTSYCDSFLEICLCKNPFENFPDCKCDRDCGPNSICRSGNFQAACSCKEGFEGSPPNIQCEEKKDCKKRCESGKICAFKNGVETCVCINSDCSQCRKSCGNGICRFVPNTDREICVCENGEDPPSCQPLYAPFCKEPCGLGECQVIADGVAECVCENNELTPPDCSPRCNKRCKKNERCVIQDETEYCICKFSGKSPNCNDDPCDAIYCDPSVSKCVVIRNIPKCQCHVGGFLDTKCEEPDDCFQKNCLPEARCILKNSRAVCICKNGGEYPNCDFKCVDKCPKKFGICLYNPSEKKSECVCKNGIGKYPNCKFDPCFTKQCPANSVCVVNVDSGNSQVRCSCKPGLAGISPFCYPSCRSLLCSFDQICVIKDNRATCVCKDEGKTLPLCESNPCENIECGEKSICIIINGFGVCRCKDNSLSYPNCQDQIDPCQLNICASNGECRITRDGRSKCVCANRKGSYPNCDTPCQINCGPKKKCFEDHSTGVNTCLCTDLTLELPDCSPSCPDGCNEGSTCRNGRCVCDDPNRRYPNCQSCDDFNCENSQCREVKGVPRCECDDGSEPPCFDCKERCPKNKECFKGKCQTKCNCNENSICHRKIDTNEPFCVCKDGGVYPKCFECNCDPNKEVCVFDKNGHRCVCKGTFSNKCNECEDCGAKGECGIVDGVERCVCKNSELIFPGCTTACPKNRIPALTEEGIVTCLCEDFKKPIDGFCLNCRNDRDCGKGAECIQNVRDGSLNCQCTNPDKVFPNCKEDCKGHYCPCVDFNCPEGEICAVYEKKPICICNSDNNCKKCNPSLDRACRNQGGICKKIDGKDVCSCDGGTDICQLECDPPCRGNQNCRAKEGGLPQCVCKNGGTLPLCEDDEGCENCKGRCVFTEDGGRKCICSNGGNPPLCTPKEVTKTPPSECGKCNGICETNPNTREKECVCPNNISSPPDCFPPFDPCKDLDCGNADCIILRNRPTCICSDRNLKPPSCLPGCECEGNKICQNGRQGECVCPPGRKEPDCKRCGLDCGRSAFCSVVIRTKQEQCFCRNGGIYPDCKTDECDKTCKENEICVLKNGKAKCICKTFTDICSPNSCQKDCGSSGKCVLTGNRREKCICLDGSDNFPACNGPCQTKICKNGRCNVKNGDAFCPCPSDPNIDEDDSECDPCAKLNCEDRSKY